MRALRNAVSRSSVDVFWTIWSRNGELGLFRAYSKAGGPVVAGSSAFLGRGLLPIRSRRLGGRAVGGRGSSRLYRISQGDEVNVHCSQYFVSSPLAAVFIFRRRFTSVADVLKGIKSKGFTQSRWDALLGYWRAVCRHGPCGFSLPFVLGIIGFLLVCAASKGGFLVPLRCCWVASLSMLLLVGGILGFVSGPVWLREDFSSRPYSWLRPDFVPPSSFCYY